jgi:periplasmic protein TonB
MVRASRCRLRPASLVMMPPIRHYAALWAIPIAFTFTLHLGLAWGALELGFGPASYTPPEFPVELVVLAAEVPEPVVQPPRPIVPPPKPRPRRPEPIETATPQSPVEPTRPPESTATASPPMTMLEQAPAPPEPKAPERQAVTSPATVETPRPAEQPSQVAAAPANESRPALEARTPVPGPAPARAADVDALSLAATAPVPGPPAPRMAAVPPNGTGSELGRVARPRGGYQLLPTYPSTARRLGIQGTALLRVLVLDDGRVGEIQVQKSAGHPDLDRAASDAVKRWRFDPARKGNENVSTWVLLPVEFRLTQR